MTQQLFSNLIEQLAEEMDLDLGLDMQGACSLLYNDTIHIQMEMDPYKTDLLIGAFISEIPPGKFRENILCGALKSNFLFPYIATLGYCESENQLFLYRKEPLRSLNGKTLSELLAQIYHMAEEWRQAIETGQLPIRKIPKRPE